MDFFTIPETNSKSPSKKKYRNCQKERNRLHIVIQPSISRGKLAVSFREGFLHLKQVDLARQVGSFFSMASLRFPTAIVYQQVQGSYGTTPHVSSLVYSRPRSSEIYSKLVGG